MSNDLRQEFHRLEPEVLYINRVCASSSLVDIWVEDIPVMAKLDSGAEITILSTKVYLRLPCRPRRARDVVMRLADQDTSIAGFCISPLSLRIGPITCREKVYVAPIGDEMLLGHDLLHHWGAIHDMRTNTLIIGKEMVPLKMKCPDNQLRISRITAAQKVTVPPNTVKMVKATLDADLGYFCTDPANVDDLWFPSIVGRSDEKPVLCFINPSDRYRSIRRGQFITTASEVSEFLQPSLTSPRDHLDPLFSCSAIGAGPPGGANVECPSDVPEHLRQLAIDSSEDLTPEQRRELESVLVEFRDVFARDDFDLGNFTALEHEIDTGDARPIKQRMRRTPAMFAGEEEAHLKKMLKAGVIQESISEWASPPVLIRKKDGSVRWLSTIGL